MEHIDAAIIHQYLRHASEGIQKKLIELFGCHVVVFDFPSGTFVIDIIGRIGDDEVRLGIAHQGFVGFCASSVPADQAVAAQRPHIPRFGNGGFLKFRIDIEIILFDTILQGVLEERINLSRLKTGKGYIKIRPLQIGDQ